MTSLALCIRKAGEYLSQQVKDEVIKRAAELRAEGMTPAEASRQAIDDVAGSRTSKLAEVETAMAEGRTLYEDLPPPDPAAKAEAQAAPTRLQQIERDFPGLKVMDGDTPVLASDMLQAVRAEADEMVADAPLLQMAAECALTFGPSAGLRLPG